MGKWAVGRGGAAADLAIPVLDVEEDVQQQPQPGGGSAAGDGDVPVPLALEDRDPDGELGDDIDINEDPDGPPIIHPEPDPPPPLEDAAVRPDRTYLLPNCASVAGMEHIVNNLVQDVHKYMPGWGGFWKQLKLFEHLLHIPDYKRRLYHTCFLGTDLDSKGKAVLDSWPKGATLYEERFKSVLNFLKSFDPVRELLVMKWSAKKYMAQEGGDDEETHSKLKKARAVNRRSHKIKCRGPPHGPNPRPHGPHSIAFPSLV